MSKEHTNQNPYWKPGTQFGATERYFDYSRYSSDETIVIAMKTTAIGLAACLIVACKHTPLTANTPDDAPLTAPSASMSTSRVASSAPAATKPTALVPPKHQPPFLFAKGSPDVFFSDYTKRAFHTSGISPMAYLPSHTPAAADDPRVVGLHRYVFIEAPESGGFYYRDLGEHGESEGGQITALTGRGRKDVVVAYRISTGDEGAYDHDVVEVWSFGPNGLEIVFTHEWGLHICCGDGRPTVWDEYDTDTAPGTITFRSSRSYHAGGPSNWQDAGLPGVPPALMPWDKKTERWTWDGRRFIQHDG